MSKSIRRARSASITTGAGLSMMLIDEMTTRGGKPLNFLDIRTGLLRNDPTRLIKTLGWIAERQSVRVVLVNIFAGITDLAEFANLLCIALERTPALKVPVVARIVGYRFAEAKAILAESGRTSRSRRISAPRSTASMRFRPLRHPARAPASEPGIRQDNDACGSDSAPRFLPQGRSAP